ncbi:hypothetical protein RRG08_043080 [Elysia crispata]|uniref:Uncharacterized protein n=1 Tax=Elysia crispata TaxID=231223 RepID=A0AAE1CPH0_9GAST|nr:hypothetical protein RRG08_043080 [Elysia crispata]
MRRPGYNPNVLTRTATNQNNNNPKCFQLNELFSTFTKAVIQFTQELCTADLDSRDWQFPAAAAERTIASLLTTVLRRYCKTVTGRAHNILVYLQRQTESC